MNTLPALSPAAAAALKKWHDMIAKNDLSDLESIVADEAVFRSPVANTPYPGKKVVCIVLRGATKVFQDFVYHRELYDSENSVCLEFAARVGDKELKGIDLVKFGGDGKIVAFEVMVRPLTGVMALGEAMKGSVGSAIKAALDERATA
ncbi:MAG: nuclear transport factor 2 family protein [Xanthobacteraceae bacterium]|nr:nuclear transport factor 2 family protein [Xanthobacteraceae bacterium]MBX3523905.1 nuclear transport factor 2 family protein [Xanthobacteraceae bacterium]MBX3535069.1 nuclear transport factor 2 family protein [Xanthobacteraceae bacterium]MBX3548597.1 nuclear transport factor 2 family protein [Xanthobacteraceae bacterium]MCW5673852.1 nuclear transport factor 2 family protein [Xanthobacteraceae bacterium]